MHWFYENKVLLVDTSNLTRCESKQWKHQGLNFFSSEFICRQVTSGTRKKKRIPVSSLTLHTVRLRLLLFLVLREIQTSESKTTFKKWRPKEIWMYISDRNNVKSNPQLVTSDIRKCNLTMVLMPIVHLTLFLEF